MCDVCWHDSSPNNRLAYTVYYIHNTQELKTYVTSNTFLLFNYARVYYVASIVFCVSYIENSMLKR